MTKIKLIAAGLALLAALGGAFAAGWTGRGWRADRDISDIKAEAQAQASAAWAAEVEANRKALADLEETNRRQAAESAALADKLREVYANDPQARAWADCPLPDSLTCLR